jgi:hypothetical protein
MVPEAHRLGVAEASVHSFSVLVTELAQSKTTGREYRVRRGFLCHIGCVLNSLYRACRTAGARLCATLSEGHQAVLV